MNILSCGAKLGSVKTAERAATHNSDLHSGTTSSGGQFKKQNKKQKKHSTRAECLSESV
jgi:hypothetical protein